MPVFVLLLLLSLHTVRPCMPRPELPAGGSKAPAAAGCSPVLKVPTVGLLLAGASKTAVVGCGRRQPVGVAARPPDCLQLLPESTQQGMLPDITVVTHIGFRRLLPLLPQLQECCILTSLLVACSVTHSSNSGGGGGSGSGGSAACRRCIGTGACQRGLRSCKQPSLACQCFRCGLCPGCFAVPSCACICVWFWCWAAGGSFAALPVCWFTGSNRNAGVPEYSLHPALRYWTVLHLGWVVERPQPFLPAALDTHCCLLV